MDIRCGSVEVWKCGSVKVKFETAVKIGNWLKKGSLPGFNHLCATILFL
jgi:hypothetical protein